MYLGYSLKYNVFYKTVWEIPPITRKANLILIIKFQSGHVEDARYHNHQ